MGEPLVVLIASFVAAAGWLAPQPCLVALNLG